jgi:hypothetical protein
MQLLQKDDPSGQTAGRNRPRRNFPVVCVVFFAVFYLFLWRYVEPKFIYHYFEMSQKSPFFKTGWLFLQDCLSYPGGPSEYIASFLTQLCYFSWLGALCITLVAWGIYRLTVLLTAIKADSVWHFICYVPAILILLISGRYESPMSTGVVVLVAAFFSVLYGKLSPRLGASRVVLFLIICGAVYYLAGSAVLVFAAFVVLYEFFNRREPVFGILFLFFGLAVCWFLGAYLFELEVSETYLYLSPFHQIRQNIEKAGMTRFLEGALFVVLPVIVLLVGLTRWLAGLLGTSHPSSPGPPGKSVIAEKTLYDFLRGRLKWVVQILLLTLISVPSVWLLFDRESKKGIQISYFACRRMWPEVLDVARRIPLNRYSSFCNHAVNRVLYHTGLLGDRMFAWPQDYRKADLIFNLDSHLNVILMERSELCLELGLVNVAEKIAHEFLESCDDSPFILKQVMLINIVKGDIETARVFLKALSRNLIYRREAKRLLRLLKSDPYLQCDEHIQHLRSVRMTADNVYTAFNEDEWLIKLLERNKDNKMAFEYLMANYLLTRRLDKFVENLPRLDDFGYESIPQHYQEAIVLYMGTTQKKVDLGGRRISPETIKQYNRINRIRKKFGKDRRLAWQALEPEFGRTYFFYFTFGVSGMREEK